MVRFAMYLVSYHIIEGFESQEDKYTLFIKSDLL